MISMKIFRIITLKKLYFGEEVEVLYLPQAETNLRHQPLIVFAAATSGRFSGNEAQAWY